MQAEQATVLGPWADINCGTPPGNNIAKLHNVVINQSNFINIINTNHKRIIIIIIIIASHGSNDSEKYTNDK